MELARKLGFAPRIVTEKKKDMVFKNMPEDEEVLEEMLKKAKKNMDNGKFYTAAQVREIAHKWKQR